MTAIVGTINRRGVAFAADSAATHIVSSKHKITNHANKIFELSKHHPVGIALCGNLDFLGLPWEEIFKMYRKHLANNFKKHLSDYSIDFLEFVKQNIMPKLKDRQISDFDFIVRNFWQETIDLSKKNLTDQGLEINDSSIFPAIIRQLDIYFEQYTSYDKCVGLESYSLENFEIFSKDIIDNVLQDCLSATEIHDDLKEKFTHTLYTIITSNLPHIYLCSTEIIIWGYGEEDLFPSYESYVINLAFDNRLRYVVKSKYYVSNDNVACVEPFAQTDVANTVVRGIDEDLRSQFYRSYKSSLTTFKDEIIAKLQDTKAPIEFIEIFHNLDIDAYANAYSNDMDSYIRANYIEKLVNTISYLSKEYLADMAESLVRMTCLKRRITSEEESVGGPVDVITKGDGFVWLKRKHYFTPELNHHYFERSNNI